MDCSQLLILALGHVHLPHIRGNRLQQQNNEWKHKKQNQIIKKITRLFSVAMATTFEYTE